MWECTFQNKQTKKQIILYGYSAGDALRKAGLSFQSWLLLLMVYVD